MPGYIDLNSPFAPKFKRDPDYFMEVNKHKNKSDVSNTYISDSYHSHLQVLCYT